MAVCGVCFRHCHLGEGETGFCGARTCREGAVTAANYGRITSMALDPIEKKPLARFHPGSLILSVGSYGCNLRCPFCQNHEISWSEEAFAFAGRAEEVSPRDLALTAYHYVDRGNIGVAFTYNEPLIGYEYVRDSAKIVHQMGMKNVLVTNGTASLSVLGELEGLIDAMNIDLKGFTDSYYRKVLGGDRQMTMAFIERAVQVAHVELTTLIVPGENDDPEEISALAKWIASLRDSHGNVTGQEIPLHISRFFPSFHMRDRKATDVDKVYHLADVARRHLKYVYTGNC